jgi:hypothetical protein
MSFASFIERPLGVARALDQGECGGSYAEACMIISGVISAMASYVWPGEQIDRKRFVELWVRFSGGSNTTRVSLPLLIQALMKDRRLSEAETLRRSRHQMFGPGYGCRVVAGEEVDGNENELISSCPALHLATLRRYAYPTVFYEHVRSKLVHEYGLGPDGKATPWPMTRRNDVGISYSNQLVKAEERVVETEDGLELVPRHYSVRRIHFHTPWLLELTTAMAANADRQLSVTPAPIHRPAEWWLPNRPR